MILQLADLFPGKLLPEPGTAKRAEAYRWLLFTVVNIHETVGRLVFLLAWTTRYNSLTDDSVHFTDRFLESRRQFRRRSASHLDLNTTPRV